MSMQSLVQTYNELATTVGRKPIKKFRDLKTAERRIKTLQEELKKKTKSRSLLSWPAANHIAHAPRSSNIRGIFVELCRNGATWDQLEAAIKEYDNKRNMKVHNISYLTRAKNYLYILHWYNGYGVEERNDKVYVKEP